jgi:microcystin-dependent protein
MALTYQNYSGTGSLTTFPISFDWLSQSDVDVSVGGVLKTLGTDYTIVNKNVVFTVAPSSGAVIKIARGTNIATRNVDFTNGSRLDETDLDNDSKQAFYLIQELSDRADTGLSKNTAGNFDAGGNKIVAVSEPSSSSDAATKNYVDAAALAFALGAIPNASITALKLAAGAAAGNLGFTPVAPNDSRLTDSRTPVDGSVVIASLAAAVQALLVPTGVIIPFGGYTSPSSAWLLCDGTAYPRSTYSSLFSVIGVNWGIGDGSTTFNVPDLRGRVLAGRDNMGGTSANRLSLTLNGTTTAGSAVVTGLSSTAGLVVGMMAISAQLTGASYTIASIDSPTQITLSTGTGVTAGTSQPIRFGILDSIYIGAMGGNHIHTLTLPQIPSHTHTLAATSTSAVGAGAGNGVWNNGSGLSTAAAGGGYAHPNVQPTAIVNYLIKI